MPQFEFVQPVGLLGAVASGAVEEIDSYTNPLLAQANTVPIGGTTDGVYTIQLDGEGGTFQFSFTASGSTAAQIADGLAAAATADPDLLNILTAAGTPGTPLLLNFLHAGQTWAISFPSNPGGNMTLTTTTAAGGTNIGLGLVVVPGSSQELAVPPTGSSAAADFLGITERSLMAQVNRGIQTETDAFEPGDEMSVLRSGDIWVYAEDAVTFNAPVFVRRTAAGTEVLGAVRSDADGGDAITWPGAVFRDTSTGAGLVRVRLNLP